MVNKWDSKVILKTQKANLIPAYLPILLDPLLLLNHSQLFLSLLNKTHHKSKVPNLKLRYTLEQASTLMLMTLNSKIKIYNLEPMRSSQNLTRYCKRCSSTEITEIQMDFTKL